LPRHKADIQVYRIYRIDSGVENHESL